MSLYVGVFYNNAVELNRVAKELCSKRLKGYKPECLDGDMCYYITSDILKVDLYIRHMHWDLITELDREGCMHRYDYIIILDDDGAYDCNYLESYTEYGMASDETMKKKFVGAEGFTFRDGIYREWKDFLYSLIDLYRKDNPLYEYQYLVTVKCTKDNRKYKYREMLNNLTEWQVDPNVAGYKVEEVEDDSKYKTEDEYSDVFEYEVFSDGFMELTCKNYNPPDTYVLPFSHMDESDMDYNITINLTPNTRVENLKHIVNALEDRLKNMCENFNENVPSKFFH